MILWLLLYQNAISIENINTINWHSHEMIFAFTPLVIMGFLLTAMNNWTQIKSIYGNKLLLLVLVWIVGRVIIFIDDGYMIYRAIVDIGFLFISAVLINTQVIKSKTWGNLLIANTLSLFALAHIIYYLGALNIIKNGETYGVYFGLYVIISILLIISRRLLPFFTKRDLSLKNELKNSQILDMASTVLMFAFIAIEVFFNTPISNIIAGILGVIHSVRCWWWYDSTMWRKPLIWSFHISYWILVLGFFTIFLEPFISISAAIATHFFAFSIALMSLSMMARVSFGHTGRDNSNPLKILNMIYILIIFSFVFRTILPILNTDYYNYWILTSQALWIGAFILFALAYIPILLKPRIDGRFG